MLGHPSLGFLALLGLGGGCPPSLAPLSAGGFVAVGLVSGVFPDGRSWVGAALCWTLTRTVAPLFRVVAESCLPPYPRLLLISLCVCAMLCSVSFVQPPRPPAPWHSSLRGAVSAPSPGRLLPPRCACRPLRIGCIALGAGAPEAGFLRPARPRWRLPAVPWPHFTCYMLW